jgi:hypothetical protein
LLHGLVEVAVQNDLLLPAVGNRRSASSSGVTVVGPAALAYAGTLRRKR